MGINKQEYIEAKKELFGDTSVIEKLITNYYGKKDLAKQFLDIQPLFYDKSRLWWKWNKESFRWEVIDETDILIMVDEAAMINTVKSKEKMEIIEALKQEARKNEPQPIKPTWIQFADTFVDITTGEEIKVSHEFFATNPIPYPLHKERYINTPIMDKIFEEWVGVKYIQTLYEIIAYCLIPSYPLHRIFCFIGAGMNGKSCFLTLLRKFLGDNNVCSTELDTLLASRFEVTRLHKKLVCQMGETNFNEMNKTSMLKKLSGGDLIGYEYKNKDPFHDINYAKIIIATNNLPITTDKTIGFYRRWLIIDFPNQFSEKKDILKEIPEEEYKILAVKCLIILKDLLDNKEFHNEGCVEDRMKKYEEKSDFFQSFLDEFTILDPEEHITKHDFYKKFISWCRERGYRILAENTIGRKMKEKGIEGTRKILPFYDGRILVWEGIKWK